MVVKLIVSEMSIGILVVCLLCNFVNSESNPFSDCNLTTTRIEDLSAQLVPNYSANETVSDIRFDFAKLNNDIKRDIDERMDNKSSSSRTEDLYSNSTISSSTSSSPCITCRNNFHEEIREANLQFIKTYVLKLLGFDETQPFPQGRTGMNVPQNILKDFYENQRKLNSKPWLTKEQFNHKNQQIYVHGSHGHPDRKPFMDGYMSDSPDMGEEESLSRIVTKTTHRIYVFNSGHHKSRGAVFFDVPPSMKQKDSFANASVSILADHNIDHAYLNLEVCYEMTNLTILAGPRNRSPSERNPTIKVISIHARSPFYGSSSDSSGAQEKFHREESTTEVDLDVLEASIRARLLNSANEVPRVGSVICGEYIKINMTSLAKTWSYRPETNHGMLIKTYPKYDNRFSVKDQDSFLEIVTSEARQRRRKRSGDMKCTEEDNETRCCRYPLTVDFEKFGWNWIIAPKKYDANYCSGECAINFLPGYIHTHVMQLATLAPACCSPRKMQPLSLLYYNKQETVVHTTLQNMSVDKCGCS